MESMSKSPVGSRDQVNSVKQQKFQTKRRGRDLKKGGPNIKLRAPEAAKSTNEGKDLTLGQGHRHRSNI